MTSGRSNLTGSSELLTVFEGEPELTPWPDGVRWTVVKTYFIIDDVFGRLMIPSGFVTDLGSIPKLFQNIISPEGKPLRAYLGHDYLYATQNRTRAQSDACLMRMMNALGVGAIERWTIYLGVRLGGWWSWRQDGINKS